MTPAVKTLKLIAVAALLMAPLAAHADKSSTTRQEATKPSAPKPGPTKPQERDIILAEEMETI